MFKHMWVICLLLAFCDAASPNSEQITLRVMTFNIWYGGEQVSFAQTAEVIRAANPDLVAVQEPDGNLRLLGELTGLAHVDEKRNILSRYPLFDPDSNDRRHLYTRVLVRPGKIVAFANTHLTSSPFGPDLLRDGKSVDEIIETEKKIRLAEVTPYINELREVAGDLPVFFAGDFNSPSHQDWQQRENHQIGWPVTKALADNGFRDSYREVFTDARVKPGLTWTPGYPHPYKKAEEINERIDMIWFAGQVDVLESKIIGETNNPAVDIVVDPYPSDHRAIVSTFRVTPATAPAMIAVAPNAVEEGTDFLIRFQTPAFEDWSVFVVSHGAKLGEQTIVSAAGPTVISTRPSIKFGSIGMRAGKYDAILSNAKKEELTRISFFVVPKNATPELKVEKASYKRGEAIKVSWRNTPGMKNDWIGIYRANDPDLFTGYIAFVYTGATVEGAVVLDEKIIGKRLEPGNYELRLMREDSYVMLAKVPFTVNAN
jgi:endonuclease/exonuclease/phosphatase family metal-dependent hydrolase